MQPPTVIIQQLSQRDFFLIFMPKEDVPKNEMRGK